jgi:hypothetical protein
VADAQLHIKLMPLSQSELAYIKHLWQKGSRQLLLVYGVFVLFVLGITVLKSKYKQGRVFTNHLTYKHYEQVKNSFADDSVSIALFALVISILFIIFTLCFWWVYYINSHQKYLDYKNATKVIELASISKIIATPGSYIICTTSPQHTSIPLADNDTALPQVGMQIILAYYPHSKIFIGYYWE